MPEEYSYHDVVVYCDNVEHRPSSNYALELTCTKAAGWALWFKWDGRTKQLGGEYYGGSFCIMVGDEVICGKKPKRKNIKRPKSIGGWNGEVINE